MNFDLSILKRAERTALQLRSLAERAGNRKYHMGCRLELLRQSELLCFRT